METHLFWQCFTVWTTKNYDSRLCEVYANKDKKTYAQWQKQHSELEKMTLENKTVYQFIDELDQNHWADTGASVTEGRMYEQSRFFFKSYLIIIYSTFWVKSIIKRYLIYRKQKLSCSVLSKVHVHQHTLYWPKWFLAQTQACF